MLAASLVTRGGTAQASRSGHVPAGHAEHAGRPGPVERRATAGAGQQRGSAPGGARQPAGRRASSGDGQRHRGVAVGPRNPSRATATPEGPLGLRGRTRPLPELPAPDAVDGCFGPRAGLAQRHRGGSVARPGRRCRSSSRSGRVRHFVPPLGVGGRGVEVVALVEVFEEAGVGRLPAQQFAGQGARRRGCRGRGSRPAR